MISWSFFHIVGEVEVLLPEAGDDLRRLVVLGDEEAAHALGGVDLAPEELEVLLVLRQARIGERHDLDAGAGGQRRLDLRVRDRHHLLAVHARHVVQQLDGDAVDLLDDLGIVEDRAVLGLDRHQQDVRGAEHLAVLLVDLDVRMLRRVEVEEVGEDGQVLEAEPDEEGGDGGDDRGDRHAVAQQEVQVRFNEPLRAAPDPPSGCSISAVDDRHAHARRRRRSPRSCPAPGDTARNHFGPGFVLACPVAPRSGRRRCSGRWRRSRRPRCRRCRLTETPYRLGFS